MPRKSGRRVPKYRRHKPTNRALVEIAGRRIYLGRFGTPESREKYDQIVSEYLNPNKPRSAPPVRAGGLLVKDVLLKYVQNHVSVCYVKHGAPTGRRGTIRGVFKKYLRPRFGDLPAADFRLPQLEDVQREMLATGLKRRTLKDYIAIIKAMFLWAADRDYIPRETADSLARHKPLKKNQTAAAESQPVTSVPDPIVEQTLAELSPVVAAMVRFARLTAARPQEVCLLRPGDIDRSEGPWAYRPTRHKTEHHNQQRIIYVGPQAQQVLMPYLLRSPDAYCFSPREEAAQPARLARTQREKAQRPRPSRRGAHYTTNSFRKAIHRACDRAGVDRWSPNRLRHSAGTEIERRYGVKASSLVMGNSEEVARKHYIDPDEEIARRVMAEMG